MSIYPKPVLPFGGTSFAPERFAVKLMSSASQGHHRAQENSGRDMFQRRHGTSRWLSG
jgi:hypothetical protein